MLKKLTALAGRLFETQWPTPLALSLSESGNNVTDVEKSVFDWQVELQALPVPGDPQLEDVSSHRIIAVGSGKGGVGKTIVSSSLAFALAQTRLAPVTAVDVDLGGANLHTGLGISKPDFALNEFIQSGTSLRDLTSAAGTDGLSFIGGASDIVGLTEFTDEHRSRFLAELNEFQAGTTILDLGAGSSLFNLDLFSLADQAVLVTTPEPTAIQNAYGFLRAAVYRRIRLLFEGEAGLVEMIECAMNHRGTDSTDTVPGLIHQIARYNRSAAGDLEGLTRQIQVGVVVNMCDNGNGDRVAEKLAKVAREYLGVRLENLGAVSWDDTVRRAIRNWQPLVVHHPKSQAACNLGAMAEHVFINLEQREALGA
jgi:flagellar biosynthesis protein FlhG